MLYIAFDQASSTSGYSVFLDKNLVSYGKFNHEGTYYDKLLKTKNSILEIIKTYKKEYPKEKVKIIFEEIQLQGNVVTFKKLAQLQGVVFTAVLEEFGIEADCYSAATWKAFNKVRGTNRTEQKRNAQKIALDSFGVKVTQDEADALLLGRYASHKEVNW